MCGIAGIVRLDGISRSVIEPRLRRALDRLSPRGPDGEGTWFGEQCAFAHRRLAIIDLSTAASQPMMRGALTIIFNGEIYNYRSIRSELEKTGHRFSTSSDTEVILAGFQEWREGIVPRLRGMFAFSIWDSERRELFAARDAFGKKPFFYRAKGTMLAFASDLIATEHVSDERLPLNHDAVRWLFTLRYIPEPITAVQGVEKLPPGYQLNFSARGLVIRPWYVRSVSASAATIDRDEVSQSLEKNVDDAAAARLVSDVPIGVFLSGGIDSAIITAAVARKIARPRTFTVGFEGASSYYEERPEAKEVARFLGTDHTEIVLDETACIEALPKIFSGLDEPFADSSAIASFIVAQETRKNVTVALSGDGADELFGGYRKHQGELFAHLYSRLPAPLRRYMIERPLNYMPESKDSRVGEIVRRLRRFVNHAAKTPDGRLAGWAQLMAEDELCELMGPDSNGINAESAISALRDPGITEDSINAMLDIDFKLVLPSDMLVKVDRMSMANGLEVRCPFLDPTIVEQAFSLPGSAKLRPGQGKWILRQAFAKRLPPSVFRRPKKGFEVPIARWLTGSLQDLMAATLDRGRLSRQGLFNPNVCLSWRTQLESGRLDTSWKIWAMIAFQQWAAVHRRSEAFS